MLNYTLLVLAIAVLGYYYYDYSTTAHHGSQRRPHVIFIIADDLGFSDVGFRNPDIISPNIDELARDGVILSSSYLQPFCSPSRAAILTGKYPYKIGMQLPFATDDKACLPLNETILPQRLQRTGYRTHAIGKWHLGFCSWDCTPTRRGFDTFYGIYAAYDDKYQHINYNFDLSEDGFDFRDNERSAREVAGQYSADLYGRRAIQIVDNHDTNTPMFMWLAFQNVHSPVTVPDKYIQMYPGIDSKKAAYYGMVTVMDEYIGKIISTLKKKKMYDNTLLIFTSDNGATLHADGASNAPFRGEKSTVWEGGTRGVTLIAGTNVIEKKGYTHDGLFHAIDWTPTVMHFANSTNKPDSLVDGIDQYEMLSKGAESKRNEFFYQVMPQHKTAIREGNYKLILGMPGQMKHGFEVLEERGFKRIKIPTQGITPIDETTAVLYNLQDDPGERTDISDQHPEIVDRLREKIEAARKDYRGMELKPDPNASPSKHGGTWSPGWC